jgi:hypothetical protein
VVTLFPRRRSMIGMTALLVMMTLGLAAALAAAVR